MTDLEIMLAMLERNGIGYSRSADDNPHGRSIGVATFSGQNPKDIVFVAKEHEKVGGYYDFISILKFDPETEVLIGVEVWE